MTSNVLMGMLNPTHSLTHLQPLTLLVVGPTLYPQPPVGCSTTLSHLSPWHDVGCLCWKWPCVGSRVV